MSPPSRHEHVEQQCAYCPQVFRADSLPAVIEHRKRHEREAHPDVRLR